MSESSASRARTVGAVVLAGVAVVVLAGGLAWWQFTQGQDRQQRAAAVDLASEFTGAWSAEDWQTLAELTGDPAAGRTHAEAHATLGVDAAEVVVRSTDVQEAPAGEASARYEVRLALAGLGEWGYEGAFDMARVDGEWLVDWSPRVLHPALRPGAELAVERSWPPRAPLLDRHGEPLAEDGALGQLVGSVGEVTEERAEELGGHYVAGDEAGVSGLQARWERRLAGESGGAVQLVSDGGVVDTLQRFDAVEGEPVHTAIDPGVQDAAEEALAGVTASAALVAVEVDSGEILGVVSRPVGGFARALEGRYPPGSTFKTVTAAALLADGLSAGDMVECPGQATIGGRSFRNAGFAALGTITFAEAFAESCNTAFVALAADLDEEALAEAAAWFGFDDDGAAVLPEPADTVEHVAAAIGQGRVSTTPAHMATVAATVASGRWRAPTLLADDPEQRSGPALPGEVAEALRDLMRQVVTDGTGTAADAAGGPVAGKTGSAEFGTGDPPRTHAWFIGFSGDVAVSVMVEGGGAGGEVAAPIAADLFDQLGP